MGNNLASSAGGILRDNLAHTIFTWSRQSGLNPLVVDRAKGVYLYSADGKTFLDFSSQLMNVNIGHGNEQVLDAVMRQMSRVSYVSPAMLTEERGRLGKKLAEITPGNLSKTFFTNGGADAIEHAVKLARTLTGRHKILALYRSYHGATYGSASVGGDPRGLLHDRVELPHVVHVENPYFYRCPWNSTTPQACCDHAVEQMERVIRFEGPENIAAIVLEGESGSSGCIKYPAGYWKKVKSLAGKFGILTIADEVMSGFGRTGKWFAVEHHEVVPDILCMAKGITSGYIPMGGFIVSEELLKPFATQPLMQGLTTSAHAVACAAANAVIDVMEEKKLVEHASHMGDYLVQRAEAMKAVHPCIGDFRCTGLLGCFELVKNRKTKVPMAPWNAAPHEMEVMYKVSAKLRELGLFTSIRWNYVFTCPPLCISQHELDEGLEIISKALSIADEFCD